MPTILVIFPSDERLRCLHPRRTTSLRWGLGIEKLECQIATCRDGKGNKCHGNHYCREGAGCAPGASGHQLRGSGARGYTWAGAECRRMLFTGGGPGCGKFSAFAPGRQEQFERRQCECCRRPCRFRATASISVQPGLCIPGAIVATGSSRNMLAAPRAPRCRLPPAVYRVLCVQPSSSDLRQEATSLFPSRSRMYAA